jgi:capsular polysaccharide export protein
MAEREPERVLAVGFQSWKRGYLPSFFQGEPYDLQFARRRAEVERRASPGTALLVWGVSEPAWVRELADARELPLWRMEDGFLRSVGLGSDLYRPASLAVDTRGIYFDPSAPSDLEHLLRTLEPSAAELARAAALRASIVEAGLSKYNVGARRSVGLARGGRPVALVVGQVEDDASIQRGCVDLRTNEALLRAARRARPFAHLVYKPHPDVVSGNRRDSLPLTLAARLCDEVVVDASLADCLAAADEVHTLTSLVGFEALLRGVEVHTYGLPFYAGWGLTHDRHAIPRRGRAVSLDRLVTAALLRYPRYVHPETGRPIGAEDTVAWLLEARRGPALAPGGQRVRRQLRRLFHVVEGVLRR